MYLFIKYKQCAKHVFVNTNNVPNTPSIYFPAQTLFSFLHGYLHVFVIFP